jgi:hypothetical protein
MKGTGKAELALESFKSAVASKSIPNPLEKHSGASIVATEILNLTKDFSKLSDFGAIPDEGLLESYRIIMDSLAISAENSANKPIISNVLSMLKSDADPTDIMALENVEEEVIL